MKSIYIILSRSGTLLSHFVYLLTRDLYTHVSLSFDESLGTLYSSSRRNGYTMFPAGPCREFLNRGVFGRSGRIPCAVYELRVSEETYARAFALAEEMASRPEGYHFNILGLLLCRLNISLPRRHHYFCSQFVGEVLEASSALELPKASTLMRPGDYSVLPSLRCVYRGRLCDLPQRRRMEPSEPVSIAVIYGRLLFAAARSYMARMR